MAKPKLIPEKDFKGYGICNGLPETLDYEVTVRHPYSQNDLASIMCSAIESGGINYWVHHVTIETMPTPVPYLAYVVPAGGSITIYEDEEGEDGKPKPHLLTREKLIEGLQKWLDWRSKHGWDIALDPSCWDTSDADCIIQFAIFGEVVYG